MTTSTEQHVDPLTAMFYPAYTKRCDHCGGYVVTTPQETLQRYAEAAYEPLAALARALQDPSAGLTGLPTMGTAGPGTGHARTHGHHATAGHWWGTHRRRGCECEDGCRCRECGRDDCHCRCCVVDADLVVHARLGERRIVPVTIENDRRREREITLELSEFSSRGGSRTAVRGRLLTPAELTLGPCQEQDVIVAIDIEAEKDDQGGENTESPRREGKAAQAEATANRRQLPDVDDCVVAYADLRVGGCDHRPVRIAVATLPRDCHAYPVDCSCGCC